MSHQIPTLHPDFFRNEIPRLLDQGRHMEAYRLTETLWASNQIPEDADAESLVHAGRLAIRLGGDSAERALHRAAKQRDPDHPLVRLYADPVLHPRRNVWDVLVEYESRPRLERATPRQQFHWMTGHALARAVLGDHAMASRLLQEAEGLSAGDTPWYKYALAEAAFLRDDWDEAHASAEAAAREAPWYYALQHLRSRLAVRRGSLEAWLEEVDAMEFPMFELAVLRLHSHLQLAERLTGKEKETRLDRAARQLGELPGLGPLAGPRSQRHIQMLRLDLATLRNDKSEALAAAETLKSPWHRRLAERLRETGDSAPVVAPHQPVWQRRNTCLPCSVATLRPEVDADALAADLTYDGTSVVECMDWLRDTHNLVSIPFRVTRARAATLLEAGHGFVMLARGENWAHAMAAVGMDPTQDTLLVHDPSSPRLWRFSPEDLEPGEAPFGPVGILITDPEHAEVVRGWIEAEDREPLALWIEFEETLRQRGRAGGEEILEKLQAGYPDHPVTARAECRLLAHGGGGGEATRRLRELLETFPGNLHLRLDLVDACHSRGNTRLSLELYTALAAEERGNETGARLPPNPVWTARAADIMGLTAEGAAKGLTLARLALRRSPREAELWHITGDLLWRTGKLEAAALPHRIAASIAAENPHYADSAFRVPLLLGRQEEGLAFLRARRDRAGRAARSAEAWVTLHQALREAGRPEEAQEVMQTALTRFPANATLLRHAVATRVDEGDWDNAERFCAELESTGSPRDLHSARAGLREARGDWRAALSDWEEECRLHPNDPHAAAQGLRLRGAESPASERQRQAESLWRAHPEHEGFFDLYCDQLETGFENDRLIDALSDWLDHEPDDVPRRVRLCHMLLDKRGLQPGDEPGELDTLVTRHAGEIRRRSFPSPALVRLEARLDPESAPRLLREAIATHSQDEGVLGDLLTHIEKTPASARREPLRELGAELLARGQAPEPYFLSCAQTGGLEFAAEQLRLFEEHQGRTLPLLRAAVKVRLGYARSADDLREARDLAREGQTLHPGEFTFNHQLATVLLRLEEHDEAERALRALVHRFPLFIPARLDLADLLAWRGDETAAVETLRELVAFAPHNPEAWHALHRFLAGRQRLEDGLEVLNEGIRLHDRNITLAETRLHTLQDLGRIEEALEVSSGLLDIWPNGAWLHFLHAETLQRAGAPAQEIEASFRKALELNPSLYAAADCLAAHLATHGREAEAFALLDTFANRPEACAAQGRRAWILRYLNRKPEARDLLCKVLKAHPDYFWGWSLLMDVLEESKEITTAREILASPPEALAHNIELRVRRIQVLENCGETNEALDREWEDLLASFPRDGRVMLTYADRCLERKDHDGVAKILDRYESVDPGAPYVLARRVTLLARSGKFAEALDLAFSVWGRASDPLEWSDETCWKEITAARNPATEALFTKSVIKHLKAGKRIKPNILAAAVHEKWGGLKMKPARWVKSVRRHPDRDELLSAVLDSLTDNGNVFYSHLFWNRLPRKRKLGNDALWASGVRIMNHDGCLRQHFRVFGLLVSGWSERPGLDTVRLANLCQLVLRRTRLWNHPPKALSEKQRQLFSEIRAICENALERFPRNHLSRYFATHLCTTAMLLHDTKTFLRDFQAHESLLRSEGDTHWETPQNGDARTAVLQVGGCMRKSPEDPNKLLRVAHRMCRHNTHPPFLFLRETVRRVNAERGIDPPMRFKPQKPRVRSPNAKDSLSLWVVFIWMGLLSLLIRGCMAGL